MKFLVVLFTFLAVACATAGTYCVGPAATGGGSGADWDHLKAWSATPARGDIWYLRDGNYTSKTFSVATSGTTLITIKKATLTDHVTETGWLSAMADQATFGAAVTPTPSVCPWPTPTPTAPPQGRIKFDTGYFVFDGQNGGGPGAWDSNLGYKIYTHKASECVRINASNITVKHFECEGDGDNDGSDNQDAVAVWGGANVTISYYYFHGIGRCPFFLSSSNFIAEYGHVGTYDQNCQGDHDEIASIWQFSGTLGDHTFRYNLFTEIQSTGGIMWDNHLNHSASCYVYGNMFVKAPGSGAWDQANGLVGGWTGNNAEDCYNLIVYNNDFVNIPSGQACISTLPVRYSGNVVENNLFYNVPTSPSYGIVGLHDYNHYINSGGNHNEPHGGTANSGDPFVTSNNANAALDDFHLIASTVAGVSLNGGAALASPFNVDVGGNIRRRRTKGAYEYTGDWYTLALDPFTGSADGLIKTGVNRR